MLQHNDGSPASVGFLAPWRPATANTPAGRLAAADCFRRGGAASLAAVSLGALIPLLPYLFGLPALAAALAVTAVALFASGIIVGRLTGRPVLRAGLRQLTLGAVAIGITFAVGSLIGHHGT